MTYLERRRRRRNFSVDLAADAGAAGPRRLNGFADPAQVRRGPQIAECAPRFLLATAVKIGPHNFELFLIFVFVSSSRSRISSGGITDNWPYAVLELTQLVRVKLRPELRNLQVIKTLELRAHIHKVLVLKSQDDGRRKFKLRERNVFKAVDGDRISCPDLNAAIHICVGGSVFISLGQRSKQPRRSHATRTPRTLCQKSASDFSIWKAATGVPSPRSAPRTSDINLRGVACNLALHPCREPGKLHTHAKRSRGLFADLHSAEDSGGEL